MATYQKLAKCPKCLPDVKGAFFRAEHVSEGKSEWVCQNCHHRMPRRVNKPTEKITPSQQTVIDQIKSYGWNVEVSFIGRNIWLKCDHPTRNLFSGDMAYGSIGPRGSFSIKLMKFGGDKELTDRIDIRCWMGI